MYVNTQIFEISDKSLESRMTTKAKVTKNSHCANIQMNSRKRRSLLFARNLIAVSSDAEANCSASRRRTIQEKDVRIVSKTDHPFF